MISVTLTWTANGTCDGYNIYRRPSSQSAFPSTPLGTVPFNVLSYTDTTVVYGSTYIYGVFAYNQAGESLEWSTVTVVVTLPRPNSPGPVSAVVNVER